MIVLLLSPLFSVVSSQSNYICGTEGNQFFSQVPCTNYPQTCANGGFKLFVGCQNDYTCSIYSQSAVCINQCCCSQPISQAAPYPYNILLQNESSPLTPFPSVLLAIMMTLMGHN